MKTKNIETDKTNRKASISRKTNETDIEIKLNLDGKGTYDIKTQIGFMDHMLELFTKHGLFDITLTAKGDIEIDHHHIIEDIGITLGKVFSDALKNRKGINRAGFFVYPMDESLALAAIDISGRPYLQYNALFKRRYCGSLDTDLIEEFFNGFSRGLNANIAIKVVQGKNDHHKIEAIFKAFAKAMKMACGIEKRAEEDMPSTKGII